MLVVFVLIPVVFSVEAAYLKFDKSTSTAANGATFQIGVMAEPGGDALSSTDIYVTYDAALLKVTTVTAGSLFPTVTNDITTSGKIYIAGMVNDPASSITTSGTVATITFQGLKEGASTLSFDCNLSKIIKNDLNATNIIQCSQNGSSAVTIGSGGGVTATPVPGNNDNNGGDNSGNSTPAELPQSGVFDSVAKLAFPGAILLILGSVLKIIL